MAEVFLKIVNMSISATWLVLAVLVLRLCLRKAPKWVNVLLWAIVAVRLLCPFSIESALSLIPSAETISPDIMMDRTPEINTGISSINSVVNPFIAEHFTPEPMWSANPLQIWVAVAAQFWFLGVLVLAIYTAATYLRLRRDVRTAVGLYDNIYQSERVSSPFVLGLFKPKIYLPFDMADTDLVHVIAHEQTHIRRRDHWWKPLGFGLLTLHWFNPLMWAAYILLCRDIELACDEKVIRELGHGQRADYSQALLSCSVDRKRIAACPLAFGEVSVKARVKNVLHYRKPAFWLVVLSVILCAILAVSMLTDPVPQTTPHAVFSTMDRGDVQWAQATIWNTPAGDHIMLDHDQTGELVRILKSIENDDYEEVSHVDNGISIMIHCGDREILLTASEEYVHFSFDTETAAMVGNTAWGVKHDGLNSFLAEIRNLRAAGDFSFSLSWGVEAQTSYDSKSGQLVKTSNATHPEDYVTTLYLSAEEMDALYDLVMAMDLNAYPERYDPFNDPRSEIKKASKPSQDIILTIRIGEEEKTIVCDNVLFFGSDEGYDDNAKRFLAFCDRVCGVVFASAQWQALPPYEYLYQ